MKTQVQDGPSFSRSFLKIFPSFQHKSYSGWMEFSDKIILPKSVKTDLQMLGVQTPFVFSLYSDRGCAYQLLVGSVLGVSEEDVIYAPLWILKLLGYDFPQNSKTDSKLSLTLPPVKSTSKDQFSIDFPACLSCLIYLRETDFSVEEIRAGLHHYSTLSRNRETCVCVRKILIRSHILKLAVVLMVPDVQCTVIEGKYFEIKLVRVMPVRVTAGDGSKL